MQKNIYAYTETEYPIEKFYPGYVSLNTRGDGHWLTVRTQGETSLAEIKMPTDELIRLADDIKKAIAS